MTGYKSTLQNGLGFSGGLVYRFGNGNCACKQKMQMGWAEALSASACHVAFAKPPGTWSPVALTAVLESPRCAAATLPAQSRERWFR